MQGRVLAPRTTESVRRANRGNRRNMIKIDREGVIPTNSQYKENLRRAQAAKNRDELVKDIKSTTSKFAPLVGKLCISASMAGVFSIYT